MDNTISWKDMKNNTEQPEENGENKSDLKLSYHFVSKGDREFKRKFFTFYSSFCSFRVPFYSLIKTSWLWLEPVD